LTLVSVIATGVLLFALYAGSTAADLNYPPNAGNDTYTTAPGTPLIVPAPGVLANDSDPDGDPLTAMLESGPAHGVLTLNVDGGFTYTPAAGFAGTDSFTYRAADGAGAVSAAATVTITVTADDDGDGIPNSQDPDVVGALVAALPDSAFSNGEHRQPILNRLDAIERLILAGDLAHARSELQSLRQKVDGCGATADTNDWIVDCAAQLQVRARIDDLIAHLV
jgi:VCBS repeat-containing protein